MSRSNLYVNLADISNIICLNAEVSNFHISRVFLSLAPCVFIPVMKY